MRAVWRGRRVPRRVRRRRRARRGDGQRGQQPVPRGTLDVRPVFTAAEMRELDRRAVADLGIPSASLMENAGRGAAEALTASLPALGAPRRGARVVVVCGKGGNGGDGFVV